METMQTRTEGRQRMERIRFAAQADVPALLSIYQQYIDTSITFEYTLPTPEEFARRVREFSSFYPYLVWEVDGRPAGYAYAHRLAERTAYQWSVELSVYLDRDHTGQGAGRRLYTALMELLRLQGIRTAYALVTSPNPPSEALHTAMGFARVGVLHRSGYKDGAWRDVTYFEKPLTGFDDGVPQPPCSIHALPEALVASVLEQA